MTIVQLEYIVAVDTYRHFGTAAERCHVTQPTLSMQVHKLEQELGIKIVFMGFGLDSDNLHSPNEKFNLENYYKGIETIPHFHKHFAVM